MILDSSGCCWEARKMLQPASRKNTPRWCPCGMIAASGLIIRWFRLASNWKCRLSLDVQWSKAATQWFVVAILKHNHLEWGSHGLAKTMISTASRRRYSNEDICRMVEGHGRAVPQEQDDATRLLRIRHFSSDDESKVDELLRLKFQQCSKMTLTYQLASASVDGW